MKFRLVGRTRRGRNSSNAPIAWMMLDVLATARSTFQVCEKKKSLEAVDGGSETGIAFAAAHLPSLLLLPYLATYSPPSWPLLVARPASGQAVRQASEPTL